MLWSLGKHIPEDRRSKPNQIKRRGRSNVLVLVGVERLHIVLTTRLFILLELAAHERLRVLQSRQAETDNGSIKVNDLHEVTKRGDTVGRSCVKVNASLPICLNVHDVIAVEIIVRQSKCPLGIRQGKNHLRDPRHMLLRLWVRLNQIVKSSLADFHDRRHNRNIAERCPGKRFGFLAVIFFLVRLFRAIT